MPCPLARGRNFTERLIHDRIFIPQRPRNQPRHRIQNHSRRQFTARQNKIPDRNLISSQMLRHALVHTLITSADQNHALQPSKPSRRLLPKHFPRRRKQHNRSFRRRRSSSNINTSAFHATHPHQRFHRLNQRLRLHHHPLATAKRTVIHSP